MGINESLSKATEIMARYNMQGSDQVAVIKILVDAGIEKCLDEQQRIREELDSITLKAYTGLVH